MRRLSDEALLAAVAPALPAQRWFPAKGKPVTFRLLGSVPLPADEDGVQVAHLLVAVDSAGPEATFFESPVLQVPLTVRDVPLPGAPVLGQLDGATVHDGPHDPAYVTALLAALSAGPPAAGDGAAATQVQGHVLGPLPAAGCTSTVLSGEQSNTSIILDVDGPDPAMLKLFRVLAPGANPDVEVTAALTQAGSHDVPPVLGWLAGGWSGAPTAGVHRGHLAVLTRFVTGGRDAWATAVAAARRDASFADEATRIGAATGRVHAVLARVFGTQACEPELLAATIAGLQHRVDWALAQAPAMADLAAALLAHRDQLAELTPQDVGPLQRVHGDLHLGQVLLDADGRVAILDFEGEPLRPLAQRTLPDLPLRDVVGMLRSFDYAAGMGEADPAWAQACGAAFVAGYQEALGGEQGDPSGPVGRALLLDKALYEVVYETRNRPDWVALPLRAVRSALSSV